MYEVLPQKRCLLFPSIFQKCLSSKTVQNCLSHYLHSLLQDPCFLPLLVSWSLATVPLSISLSAVLFFFKKKFIKKSFGRCVSDQPWVSQFRPLSKIHDHTLAHVVCLQDQLVGWWLDNHLPPRPLLLDYTMTHDRFGGKLTNWLRSTGAPQPELSK